MKRFARLIMCGLGVALLSACATTTASTEPAATASTSRPGDVAALVGMGAEATELVRNRVPNAVLRQMDTDLRSFTFSFTDEAATEELDVYAPAADAPAEQWTVRFNSVSPLIGQAQPGIDLASLKISPQRVAEALASRWPGCVLHGMTLYSEGGALAWVAFCETVTGLVSGTVDNRTGVFRPSTAPPGSLPLTATPIP